MRAYAFGIGGWLVLIAFHLMLGRRVMASALANRNRRRAQRDLD